MVWLLRNPTTDIFLANSETLVIFTGWRFPKFSQHAKPSKWTQNHKYCLNWYHFDVLLQYLDTFLSTYMYLKSIKKGVIKYSTNFTGDYWSYFSEQLSFMTATYRSCHQSCSIKTAVLKNFAIFTWRHLCWSLFLIKLEASAALLKKDSNAGVFL